MNQILYINKSKKIKKFFKYQLIISIILLLIFSVLFVINKINSNSKERYSKELLDNYNITKLYANIGNIENNENYETITDNQAPYIIGTIEIPKINIYYPIFSTYNENLLKISPCKFYGPEIGKKGNLCIAGHNYDNNKFFSKIGNLNIDDEIVLYNNSNDKFVYIVNNIYEVKENDTSPIYEYKKSAKQLTLITCNNLNKNRIIVTAIL